jgi:uncharacterized protein (DUF169 family)
MMLGMSYVRQEEIERIPKMEKASSGIVYGPLKAFPLRADAVLVWLTPRQAMILNECCGLLNWAAAPTDMLGRPGCASIPRSIRESRVAQSFGCVGMRVNTAIPEDRFLMVLPGDRLEAVVGDLDRTWRMHQQLEQHYIKKQAALLQ